MKRAGYTFAVLSFLLLSSFRLVTDSVVVSGHLKSKSKKSKAMIDNVYVCAKEDDKIVAEGETDEEGNFTLDIEREEGSKNAISFFYVNDKSDTILLKKVARFTSDTPEYSFGIE